MAPLLRAHSPSTAVCAFMFSSIPAHFTFNLLLQLFDGLFTYYVLSLGVPEANPLVRGAIASWGAVWGLVYCKLFACAMLALIVALRHAQRDLSLQALTITSTIYGGISVISLVHFLWLS
jgi:uncharacterized protein DUF5658